jgi:hypothetical protein
MVKFNEEEDVRRTIRKAIQAMNAWALSDEQVRALLGGIDLAQLHALSARAEQAGSDLRVIPDGLLQRTVCICSIYDSLHILFDDGSQADGWIRRPNDGPGFNGRPALMLMLDSYEELDYVCRYLKGWTV